MRHSLTVLLAAVLAVPGLSPSEAAERRIATGFAQPDSQAEDGAARDGASSQDDNGTPRVELPETTIRGSRPGGAATTQAPSADSAPFDPNVFDQPPDNDFPNPNDVDNEGQFTEPYQSLGGTSLGGLSGVSRSNNSLFEQAGLGTVIDRNDIRERSAADMFAALQGEVGVLVQRTARGQSSPFVRGLTGQQVLLLVDGIRINNSTFRAGANQYFNTIDPGMVERIEVLRGPQSVMYGSDALGGAINVATIGPSRTLGDYSSARMGALFSTADTGVYTRTSGEGWYGCTGVYGGASYLNVNDLDRGGAFGRQPFTNYDQYAGDIKLQHMLDEDTVITFAVQHFEQNNLPRSDRFAPFALGPPVGTVRPTFFDPQQRDLAYARIEGTTDGLLSAYVITGSYHRQKEGVLEIFNATREEEGEFDVGTSGITLLGMTDLDGYGIFTYGFDWYHDDVDSFKNRRNPATGAVTAITPQFQNDSFYERLGTYIHWDVLVTDWLQFNSGVRYEMVDLGGTPNVVVDPPGPPPPVNVPTHISPSFDDWVGSAGVSLLVTEETRLYGSFSEGFRAPNLDDLVATNTLVQQAGGDIPSINLGPEHSYTYELGLKYDGDDFRSQVAVFWTDLQNNILRTPAVAGLFQRSNRDSYIQGVEWYGEYLITERWSAYGNFSYVFGRDNVLDVPLSRIPPTQGIIGARWRDPERRTWFELYAWLVRRQDRVNFQDLSDARIPVGGTPGFQTLNMRMGTHLGRCDQHELSLTLENLFDQHYRVHGSGVDGPGFNAIFGYAYIW